MNLDVAGIGCAGNPLGALPLRVFFTITLPLTLPGIFSGMILSFARILVEFGATITFVSNIPGETQTIPLSMFAFIETPGAEANVARLCMISICISLLALWLSGFFTKQMQVPFWNCVKKRLTWLHRQRFFFFHSERRR